MLLSENYDVLYISELNCVFVKWKRYCEGEDYRRAQLHALDIIDKHEGCHYIVDMRDGFKCSSDDDTWLHGHFAPLIYDSGCRHFFYIKNSSSLLDGEIENQSALMQRFFSVHCCENFDDIKLILLSDPEFLKG